MEFFNCVHVIFQRNDLNNLWVLMGLVILVAGDCFFFRLFIFFFIYQISRGSFKAGTACLAMLVAPE